MDYIKVGNLKLQTILAITSEEQEKGLMYTERPLPIMSFVYASPKINKFWMKNVNYPLDIVFCLNNRIISICSGEPQSTKLIGGDVASDLVVEFPGGYCKANGIKIEDDISLEFDKKSLMKLFINKNGM